MSATKRRQEALKRAAARNLNSLTAQPSAARTKAINGNTLKRVARALSIVSDDAQPAASRLRLYAWLVELEERFARRDLNGVHGEVHSVPARLVITVPAGQLEATQHAVRTLCSAHGYTGRLAGRVWLRAPGAPAPVDCPLWPTDEHAES